MDAKTKAIADAVVKAVASEIKALKSRISVLEERAGMVAGRFSDTNPKEGDVIEMKGQRWLCTGPNRFRELGDT